eukprot:gene26175-32711_t
MTESHISPAGKNRWQFWIDRGGTFTDVVGKRPDGTLVTHKLLSENPEQYRDAAVAGIRHLLGLKAGEPVTPEQVECVKMGTTVATNALLERKGEATLLVTTQGFGDALRIAYQNRPRLFDRQIVLPELLYSAVVEAQERVTVDGEVLQPLDEAHLRTQLVNSFAQGVRSVAVVFMHGWRHTAHEQAAARLAREVGFTQVSTSHQTSPMMKLVSRGDTTVVDAYLSPILRRYVDQVASEMPGVKLMFMQSSGGLTDAQVFAGKDAILSGPAGGIVGMARTAQLAGHYKVIGFDMGGTSTDVSHFAGQFEREFETQVAGVRMRAPMMSIHTVAAGGGSLLAYDGARFRVGPQSAGANPGPASYRRGGPLAVTDDDEDNIMSCLLAKRMGASRVLALINRRSYADLMHGTEIDIALSPAQAMLGELLAFVRQGDVQAVHSLRRGVAEALEIVVRGDRKSSRVVGRKVSELHLPRDVHIGLIVRGLPDATAPAGEGGAVLPEPQVIIPRSATVLESNDHVVFFLPHKRLVREVEKLFRVSATFF